MMRTVAFLQNAYFKPGTLQRHIDMYHTNLRFRQIVLTQTATGKALIRAFDVDFYDAIHWDNASTEHGFDRRHKSRADTAHMATVLADNKPQVLILFGREAQDGFAAIERESTKMFGAPHPPSLLHVLRARHPMAMGLAGEHLRAVATEFKRIIGEVTWD